MVIKQGRNNSLMDFLSTFLTFKIKNNKLHRSISRSSKEILADTITVYNIFHTCTEQ